uniref:Patatin n=1 Tax=Anthurium amnicola TaxID=1678845 RepID=A0A1D1XMU2_9ARAE
MLPPLLRLRRPSLAASPRPLMASLVSLLPSPGRLPSIPNPASRAPLPSPSRPGCLRFYARAQRGSAQRETPPAPRPPPPVSEKKSIAVATGELFLGVASLLLRRRTPGPPLASVLTDEEEEVALCFSERGDEAGAAVVGDPVDEEVVWEQRLKDVEAEKQRKKVTSPGFSFSAAGLLFPYHLGVAQLLLERGYIKETTPLAGSSAGAIVCVVIASGNTMQDALKVTKVLAEDCRIKGTAFRLGAVLRDVLKEFLPDDVHVRSNGRVRVAVTQLLWRPKGLLVDQFDSKEDLINAVFTSSFIPGYLAPRPATLFRNRLCIDGGLTLFMPPTSASETVRVCAFPASRLGLKGIGISPDCNPENRASPRQVCLKIVAKIHT